MLAVLAFFKSLPWKYILPVLAVLGLIWWGHHYLVERDKANYDRGVAAQVAVDKPLFDKANAQITQQKAEAVALLNASKVHADQVDATNKSLKTQLEQQSVQHHQAVTALANKYAGELLQYRVTTSTSGKDSGRGQDSSSTVSQGSGSPAANDTAIVQLPGPLASDLRQFAKDADDLKVEYQKCYAWANRPKDVQFDPSTVTDQSSSGVAP